MKIKALVILLLLSLFKCTAAAKRAKLSEDEIQLFKALGINNMQAIQRLINAGVNVNVVTPEEMNLKYECSLLPLDKGETPLNQAVQWPKFNAAKALIDAGANINAPAGESEDTPLHTLVKFAAAFIKDEWTKILEYLLERGANPFARNAEGFTVFDVARNEKKRREEWIKSNIKKHPNPDKLNARHLKEIKNMDAVINMLNRHREIRNNYQKKLAFQIDECLGTFNLPPELTSITLSYIEAGDWGKNIKPKTQKPPEKIEFDLDEDTEVEI